MIELMFLEVECRCFSGYLFCWLSWCFGGVWSAGLCSARRGSVVLCRVPWPGGAAAPGGFSAVWQQPMELVEAPPVAPVPNAARSRGDSASGLCPLSRERHRNLQNPSWPYCLWAEQTQFLQPSVSRCSWFLISPVFSEGIAWINEC